METTSGFDVSSRPAQLMCRTTTVRLFRCQHSSRGHPVIARPTQSYRAIGASLRRLAARLGMSQPSLYHYFTSKDELITAILDYSTRKMMRSGE